MPVDAFGLALAAAIVHAGWNLLLADTDDVRAATAVMLLVGIVVLAPVAALTWDFTWGALPYAAGSATLELAYFALLALAYARAELSLVYPIARGLAPLLVLAVSVLLLSASARPLAAAGIVLVACGVLAVSAVRGRIADPAGVVLALLVGGSIAGYTLVDKEGLQHASPIAYLEVVSLFYGPAYALALGLRRGVGLVRAQVRGRVVLAGVGVVAAYGLVLAALARAPAAPVAAVRESSVLIAALLAPAVLGERLGAARLAGAAAIAAGVALVALS